MSVEMNNHLAICLVHLPKRKKKVAEKFVQNSVQKELDDTIFELPDPPKLELGDGLLITLGVEADDILEQKFVNQKQQEVLSLNKSRKNITLMKLKMPLMKVAFRNS